MARVAPNRQINLDDVGQIPFMDCLTHCIIKQTSKTLQHYIDVKRRENGFILSPSIGSDDKVPLKARFLYGTCKEYPSMCRSFHTDSDVKGYLRTIRQHQREHFPCKNDLEKQICLDELTFHMHSRKRISTENQYFNRLQLNVGKRSHSSCSGSKKRRDLSHSVGRNNEPIVDTTANILAELVKSRQRVTTTEILTRNKLSYNAYHNANPSPRQTDEPSNTQGSALQPNVNYSEKDKKPASKTTRKKKAIVEDNHANDFLTMRNAKLIDDGILSNYTISVYTGDRNGASTNAQILITLYGDKGHTPPVELKQSTTSQFPFQRGQVDVFEIQTFHVGRLAGITIGHNKKESQAGWFLNSVTIEDSIREDKYIITCNAWLSSKSLDHKTMRDFQVSQQQPSSSLSRKHIQESSYRNSSNYQNYSMKEMARDIEDEGDISSYRRENTVAEISSDEYTRERPFTSKGQTRVVMDVTQLSRISRTNFETSQTVESKEANKPSTQDHSRASPLISRSPTSSNEKLSGKPLSRPSSPESITTRKKDEKSFRPISPSSSAAAEDDFFQSTSPKLNRNEKVTVSSRSPEVPTASKQSPPISYRSSASNTETNKNQIPTDEKQKKSEENSSSRSSFDGTRAISQNQNDRPRSPLPTKTTNQNASNFRGYTTSSSNSGSSRSLPKPTTTAMKRSSKSESDESELDPRPPARLQNRYSSSDSDDSDSNRYSKKYD